METTVLNVIALAAFGLLITVSGGIIYLTAAEWRDRRRQDQEKRSAKRSPPKRSPKRR